MIIGLDFDGTCCMHDYPRIGAEIGAVPWLTKAQEDFNVKIILFTMRSGAKLEAAREWLEDKGVKIHACNVNPSQHTWTTSPKPYCHVYIDDAALGTPLVRPDNARAFVDWRVAGPMLMEELARHE